MQKSFSPSDPSLKDLDPSLPSTQHEYKMAFIKSSTPMLPVNSFTNMVAGFVMDDAPPPHNTTSFVANKFLKNKHEIALLRASLTSLLAEITDGSDFRPDYSPFWTLLSPHLRISLLAEVGVGLLCRETELPEDRPELFAAYR